MARIPRFGRLNRHQLGTLIIWAVGLCFALGGLILLWAATLKMPDLSSIENRKIEQSLQLYDRTGDVLLYDANKNVDRIIVPLDQIATTTQNAIIAMEDGTFYTNAGFVPSSFARAVLADITSLGKVQGGSTITQQVVKQTMLSGDKTITRKLKEIVLSLKLTRALPKAKILEIYLNQAPFGGSIYGVEEASRQFFGVPASSTTLAQSAYLAAMLPAPSYYSPYGNHKEALDGRKNLVLDVMAQRGIITTQERDQAKKEQVVFQGQKTSSILAPHFVFYVEQYLEEKYGEEALSQSGWKIITTLDADLQAHAEEIVQKRVPDMQKNYNASNAGLTAVDPQTGQILVMVGSRNYFDTEVDGNFNVTLAKRQPGSTFKPFAYAVAFQKGFTPNTVLFDVPTQFSTSCTPDNLTMENGCYAPSDFDDKWRGPMTLREALAQSINVPAVEVLYLAGLNNTLQLAKSMGISTLGKASQYGLTLVLGGGEVTLLEMTSAYGTFATGGTHYPTTPVLRIEDQNGKVIEDNSQPVGTTVLDPSVASNINDILSDNVARAPEFGTNSALYFPGRDVAVKTGTTNDYHDAWVIGYTPNFAAGAWAGNNDNTAMTKNIAGFIIAPLWNEFMNYALTKEPEVAFQRSDSGASNLKPALQGIWQGGDATVVDSRTGGAADSTTPAQFLQYRVICNVHSILYWVDKDNPLGPSPREGSNDSQFPYWEAAIARWNAQNGSCAPGSQLILNAPASFTAGAYTAQ